MQNQSSRENGINVKFVGRQPRKWHYTAEQYKQYFDTRRKK